MAFLNSLTFTASLKGPTLDYVSNGNWAQAMENIWNFEYCIQSHIAGIKSCRSARTGGGEDYLIIFERGDSIISKEIKEPGS